MAKKKSKKKTAQRPRRLMPVVLAIVVGLVLLFLFLNKKKEDAGNFSVPTSSPAVQTDASRFFVPRPVALDIQFRGGPAQPWVDRQRLLEALDLILSLRSSPELQTPHDQAIMRLAQEYKDGRKPFLASYEEMIAIGSDPNKPTYGRLGQLCPEDEYGYGHVQSHLSILAISLYHELFHGADCAGYLGERLDPTDPNQHEPGAYAAQIRMFLALYRAGRLYRLELSAEEPSDTGVLAQTHDVWQALVEDRFAAWYQDVLAHPDQPPQP